MQAVIPAAGRGSRMGALTSTRPKGLVPVAGRPLIEYAMAAAVRLGADRLVVVTGYRGDELRARLGATHAGRPIRYVEQPERRGLADAVAKAGTALEGDFLLVNGDNVFGEGLDDGRRELFDDDGALLVEVADRKTARRTGVVEVGGDHVVRAGERPEEPSTTLVTTGVYALPAEAVHACHLVTPSDRGECELADAVDLLVRAGYRIRAVPFDGERVNVNTPADLTRADRLVDA
ncbi:MAG: sugar phosphate nucleotidyltransferase [Halobacteriales archaeon]